MSTTRQPHWPQGLPPPATGRRLIGYRRDGAETEVIDWHHHAYGQLVYAAAGLLKVETDEGIWVVPPQRAVWVPAGIEHRVTRSAAAAMRNLYLLPALPGLPERCQVLSVSPLLRELILDFSAQPQDYGVERPTARLAAVILDQLRAAAGEALHLPLPRDRRLRPIVEGLLADPADPRDLAGWARAAGASSRTLARLFEAETGMGFREWRRQLRLQEALARLTAGEPVTGVAFAVGYDSPSAFIAMFRRAMGESPRRYLARQEAG